MKKLFVLFLLVALVPFTVGCGLFGDNDDTTPITTNELVLSNLFPADTFSGSLRAATVLDITKLVYRIKLGATTIPMVYKSHRSAAGGIEVFFSAYVIQTTFEQVKNAAAGTVTAEVAIVPTGSTSEVVLVSSTPVATSGITSGTAPKLTTTTPVVNQTAVEKAIGDAVSVYKVDSAKVHTTGVVLSTDSESPTELTYGTSYMFDVTFSSAWTNTATPTFEVEVDNVGTTSVPAQKITNADTAVLSVNWDSTKKIAMITVTPSTAKPLTRGATYSIALAKTDAVAGTLKASLPAAYFIKIAQ